MEKTLVELLMARDSITYDIAVARIRETADEIIENPNDYTSIIREYLGLDDSWLNEVMSI